MNLDVQEWIKSSEELKELIDKIMDVMKQARMLKNRNILSELTSLVALLPNVTRWSSVQVMLDRFIEIHAKLVQLQAKSINFDMQGADPPQFLAKCMKYQAYMTEIDKITKVPQNNCQSFESIFLIKESVHVFFKSF